MGKFDGTGNVDSVSPGNRFDSDFAVAIPLIDDIRVDKPDTYINFTIGTWASPLRLKYADSIWRDGYDQNLAGEGPYRAQMLDADHPVTITLQPCEVLTLQLVPMR